jgi:hypothetical protein
MHTNVSSKLYVDQRFFRQYTSYCFILMNIQIEYTRRLKLYEQKKLDIQKENLKKFQYRLTKEYAYMSIFICSTVFEIYRFYPYLRIEDNNRKHRFEKMKQTDALRNRRVYLRRRVQVRYVFVKNRFFFTISRNHRKHN